VRDGYETRYETRSVTRSLDRARAKDAQPVQARELRQENETDRLVEIEKAVDPEENERGGSGEKIAIRYREPESPKFFQDFSVDSILDFDRQASDLHTHLTNGQTNEALVSLYQLQHEKSAVDKLESAFQKTYHTDLETALTEHFGHNTPLLEYSRQLIGKGEKTSELAITHVPKTPEDFSNLVKRIHHTLNTTEEFIPEKLFAALTPLRRNTDLLVETTRCYAKKFDNDLIAAMKERPGTGEAADFAGFLLGEKKLEKKFFTEKEADHLSAAFSQQSFEYGLAQNKPTPEYAKVPYDYPDNGCHYRSFIMSQSMKEMGFASEQVVITNNNRYDNARLKFATDYAGDANIQEPTYCLYDYHISPKIKVQIGDKLQDRVLDPMMNQGKAKHWPLKDWEKQLFQGYIDEKPLAEIREILKREEQHFKRLQEIVKHEEKQLFQGNIDGKSLAEIREIYKRDEQRLKRLQESLKREEPNFQELQEVRKWHSYPLDKTLLFSVSRDILGKPETSTSSEFEMEPPPIPSQDWISDYRKKGIQQLTEAIKKSRSHTLAAIIREESKYTSESGFDKERFEHTLIQRSISQDTLNNFADEFPELHTSFAATLKRDQRESFLELVPTTQG
jgi:hypothetical protein